MATAAINLAGKSPTEVMAALWAGELLIDGKENADAIMMTLIPTRGEYYQVAALGEEYVVRTPGREYEALRVPRTLGGIILLMQALPEAVKNCGLYIATGGRGHF